MNHIKRSIIYFQTLRVNRRYSLEKDLLDHTHKMKSLFEKKDYPQNMINKERKRVKFWEKQAEQK